MSAYYNEHDPKAAAWLRELIRNGHIADGEVDERSIVDVRPSDLDGFTQCHFFAGIGGWSLALRIAGWPADRPVWTGSCPCQPFSAAGRRRGTSDERHLWPAFHWLIDQCSPSIVFGEQVASKGGLGWLDLVCTDLEGSGYAVGSADLCAASVGAPHIRQRLWWGGVRLADANDARLEGRSRAGGGPVECTSRARGVDGGLADANREHEGSADHQERSGNAGWTSKDLWLVNAGRSCAAHGGWEFSDWLWCRDERWRPVEPGTQPLAHGIPARVGRLRGYGNAIVPQVAAEFIRAFQAGVEEVFQ